MVMSGAIPNDDRTPGMKPCIFIHTNEKQIVGALVSKYSFERFSSDKAAFDVKLIHTRDYRFLTAHEGQTYLRGGLKREWRNDDLQSFTVLRFMPPELMGYAGRSIVVDPDVFCVAGVMPLLKRDMEGKAIMARPGGARGRGTSGMLGERARFTPGGGDALEVMARTPTLAEQPLFAA